MYIGRDATLKKSKLIKILGLAAWGIVTVAVYVAAVKSRNAAILSAVTNALIAIIAVCAALYSFLYVKIIGLRNKANCKPEEKFDFEAADKLTEDDKRFLRRANTGIKLIMIAALPPIATVLCDVVITMLI